MNKSYKFQFILLNHKQKELSNKLFESSLSLFVFHSLWEVCFLRGLLLTLFTIFFKEPEHRAPLFGAVFLFVQKFMARSVE